MSFLRQSTQVVKMIGPYLDKTDGVTEEVGLAGGGTEISKEPGAAFGTGPTLGTHDAEGWYPVTLTTTHTDTVGLLKLKGQDAATHLPVWEEWTVVEEAVYDALYAAGAAGPNVVVPDAAGVAATPADVNAQVVDVLDTDTWSMPGQTAPPLAPTFRQMMGHLYKAYRNRKTMTSTQWSLLADDESTVDQKATVSDDGSTATKQEIETGP